MPATLLHGHDEAVLQYLESLQWQRVGCDRALGIINDNGYLVGAVLFHCYNGFNVELSYYGERTMTPGIIRGIAEYTIYTFNAARLTVTTSKRNHNFKRALLKIGFKFEGTQRCWYGHRDSARNTGARFVMFRDRLNQIARVTNAADAPTGGSAPE